MSTTSDILRTRYAALLIGVLTFPCAIAAVELVRPIIADVDYLGTGPSGLTYRLLLGGYICYRGLVFVYELWVNQWTHVPWWFFGRELVKFLLVLPLSVLVGRVAFTFIPPWDPFIGCILGPALTIFFFRGLGMKQDNSNQQPEFRRGARMLSEQEAETKAASLPRGDEPPQQWAGFQLPASSPVHTCVVGGTGAGKTRMIRSQMKSIVRQIRPSADRRAIVYDVKLDAISELMDMGIDCPLVIFNPFDTRSWAWDIAKDLTDPVTADQYAGILFPSGPGDEKNRYFTDAAQALVGGVLMVFVISKKPWTLRDLIHVTATETRLRNVLLSSEFTRDRVASHFEPKDTFKNILSTIANAMVKLQSVAAVWHHTPAERHISLNEWCRDQSSILVLGKSFDRSETLTLLNQIVFRRLSELLLSGPESQTQWKTWIFLDELQEAGKLDGLRQLLTDGRSKGVRLTLGFQDIEGLRDVYGEHQANSLPAMCGNLSILNLRSSFTAEWASDQIGEVENFEYVKSFGTSRDKDGNVTVSNNTTANIEARRALLPSEIMSFALTKGGYVFGCHFIHELTGFVARTVRCDFHEHRAADDFSPRRKIEDMLLPPWTKADADRLGIPFVEEFTPANDDASKQKPNTSSGLDDLGRLKSRGTG